MKTCSIYHNSRGRLKGKRCINPFCYNFFIADSYKGSPRLCCSDICKEQRRKFTYVLGKKRFTMRFEDIQSQALLLLYKTKYFQKDLYYLQAIH